MIHAVDIYMSFLRISPNDPPLTSGKIVAVMRIKTTSYLRIPKNLEGSNCKFTIVYLLRDLPSQHRPLHHLYTKPWKPPICLDVRLFHCASPRDPNPTKNMNSWRPSPWTQTNMFQPSLRKRQSWDHRPQYLGEFPYPKIWWKILGRHTNGAGRIFSTRRSRASKKQVMNLEKMTGWWFPPIRKILQ